MSYWTYINGTIYVLPMGRTQAEKRYILDTVLSHLPIVSGSERDMNIYVIQKNGYSSSSFHDEFGQRSFMDYWGDASRMQDTYILVVEASLRDRQYSETYRMFQKWLCRLAKRVQVDDVLVEIHDFSNQALIRNTNDFAYSQMFEDPTWRNIPNFHKLGLNRKLKKFHPESEYTEPNWCEYLMWNRAKDYDFPMMLAYKYFNDEENDKEVERRIDYMRGECK